MTTEDSGSRESTPCCRSSKAVEAREDIGKKRITSIPLDVVLIGLDIAAAEDGFALGDLDGVKHAITVKEMVRPTRQVLWVWAIANIGTIKFQW